MDQYDIDWKRTFNALKRGFVHNRDNRIFIAQVVRHASGPSLKWSYAKMLKTRLGGEIIYNREEISDYLLDLKNRPEGSVGRACYDMFPDQAKLLQISRRKSNDEWIEGKHPYSWMARRYRDTHDIWHILTGYPPTGSGEMCLTMFSYVQTKSLAWLLISIYTLFAYGVSFIGLRMMYEAYKNGKAAECLLSQNYDELLSENLESARKRLNIKSPKFYVDLS